jgi:hypothetical protein
MVCLQPRLKSWVAQQAAQEEMALSTWIRSLIAREAKRDLRGQVYGSEVCDGGLRVTSDD